MKDYVGQFTKQLAKVRPVMEERTPEGFPEAAIEEYSSKIRAMITDLQDMAENSEFSKNDKLVKQIEPLVKQLNDINVTLQDIEQTPIDAENGGAEIVPEDDFTGAEEMELPPADTADETPVEETSENPEEETEEGVEEETEDLDEKFVFDKSHAQVKDGHSHFPMRTVTEARNSMARASVVLHEDKAPVWFDGEPDELKKQVFEKVYSKFPSIAVSKK